MDTLPTKINVLEAEFIKDYDGNLYKIGIRKIEHYRYTVYYLNKKQIRKKRIYIIELHHNEGFAMIKFYPKDLKGTEKKYEIRVMDKCFNTLSYREIRGLFMSCIALMKQYLKEHPNNLVGYFGQPDKRDHNNQKRYRSQRASVYDTVALNLFRKPKYILNEKEQYGEINCRFIQNGLNVNDKLVAENQNRFLDMIISLSELHPEMMTEATKVRIYGKEILQK